MKQKQWNYLNIKNQVLETTKTTEPVLYSLAVSFKCVFPNDSIVYEIVLRQMSETPYPEILSTRKVIGAGETS